MATKKLKSKQNSTGISAPQILAIEAAKAHRRAQSRNRAIDLNLAEVALASLSSAPKPETVAGSLSLPQCAAIVQPIPRKPSLPSPSPRRSPRTAQKIWTISPIDQDGGRPVYPDAQPASSSLSAPLTEHLADIRQRLADLQQRLTALQQQSNTFESTMGELRSLSQQMNAIVRPRFGVSEPRMSPTAPIPGPLPPRSEPKTTIEPPTTLVLNRLLPDLSDAASTAGSSDAGQVEIAAPEDSSSDAPSIVRSNDWADTAAIEPAPVAAKPSLICIRDPELLEQLRAAGVLRMPVVTETPAIPESIVPEQSQPSQNRRPKGNPAPDRLRHSLAFQTTSAYLQQRLRIPSSKRAIVIDGSLWILSAIGLRMGLTSAMQAVPIVIVPLSLALWMPTIGVLYLAFFLPQSNVTVLYRLLLLAVGFFVGSWL